MIAAAPDEAGAAAAAPLPAAGAAWQCGRHVLTLDRVRIMGILNLTPDSFSDGGRYAELEAAVARAQALVAEGADILDIGGESTRPGAAAVPPEVERARVLPLLEALHGLAVPISVDTSEPTLMRTALAFGASIINDVRALRRAGALEAVRDADCGVVLMHMPGEPATMQQAAHYADVTSEVGAWLARRRDEVLAAGVGAARIVLDPGFGFGKNHQHNRELLARLPELLGAGAPLLVGLSRKSSLGDMTGRPVAERLPASLAAALLAAERGARIVRVHDVAATRDALNVWENVRRAVRPPSARGLQ